VERRQVQTFISVFNWKLGAWSALAQWFPAFFAVYPAGISKALTYAFLHGLFQIVWAGFFGGWTERLATTEKTRWKGYLKGALYPSLTSSILAYAYHLLLGNPEAGRTVIFAFLISAFLYAPSTIFLISHPCTRRYFARSGAKRLILSLTLVFAAHSCLFATLDENVPLGHWAYPAIDELLLRGYGANLLYMNRPYTRGEVAGLVIEVEREMAREGGERAQSLEEWMEPLAEEFADDLAMLRGQIKEEFYRMRVEVGADFHGSKTEKDIELEPAFMPVRSGDEGDPHFRMIAPLGYAISIGKRLTVSEIAWIDTEMRNDPTASVREDSDKPLRFRSAYIKYRHPNVEVLFGRERFRWGPGTTGGLVLGDSSPSLDVASLTLRAKWFTLTSIVSPLGEEIASPGEPAEDSPVGEMVNRYFYAHRLDMKFVPWLEFGISETAVVTGVGRGFDLRFMNPLLAVYSTQHEGDRNQREVNLTHSLHWFIARVPRIALYGELFIDEIFLKEQEDTLPRPNCIGFLQGVALPDPFGLESATARAEYVRIGSFVYVHRGLNTDYENFGSPLGHPFGPDTDQTSVSLTRSLADGLTLTGSFAYRRRGEIRIDTGEASLGKTSSFLQGIVERRRMYTLSARFRPRRDLYVSLDTSYIRASNLGNIEGRSEGLMDVSLLLSYHMRWFR
jgi:hypothetical protein